MRRWQIVCGFLACAIAPLSNATAQPAKDMAYFCTAEFSGGLRYDELAKKWTSSLFKPEHKFVARLKYRGPKTSQTVSGGTETVQSFDVTVTEVGKNVGLPCFAFGDDYGAVDMRPDMFVWCTTFTTEYKFNFKANRFLSGYLQGYVDGIDTNADTPSVSGGACTKID